MGVGYATMLSWNNLIGLEFCCRMPIRILHYVRRLYASRESINIISCYSIFRNRIILVILIYQTVCLQVSLSSRIASFLCLGNSRRHCHVASSSVLILLSRVGLRFVLHSSPLSITFLTHFVTTLFLKVSVDLSAT